MIPLVELRQHHEKNILEIHKLDLGCQGNNICIELINMKKYRKESLDVR